MSLDLVKALILGIVEGLTEFLPISSTGHLIIAEQILGFDDARGAVFLIVIQTGAIMAVCWEYRHRLLGVLRGLGNDAGARRFAANVAIAFTPLALLGLVVGHWIKAHLFNPVADATAFIIGGLVILWAERRRHEVRVESVDAMSASDALKIGLVQTFALIPGMSRAGSTIVGGLLFGLSRRAAAEFSFFLAIPTLLAASALELVTQREHFGIGDLDLFAAGFGAAFVSAFFAVRGLLRYISHHDFTAFAWYRIGFGVLVLATAYSGMIDWSSK